MKSKTLKQNKVNIITLGCSKNLVDSEMLSGQLVANDIDVVHENKKLDHNIVVVNTCGFIDKAKEESVNTILDDNQSGFMTTAGSVTINSITATTLNFTFTFTREDGEVITGNYSGNYVDTSN